MSKLLNCASWTALISILCVTTFGFKLVLLCISSTVISVFSLYIALHQHAQHQKHIGDISDANSFKLNLLTTPGLLRILSRREFQTRPSLVRLDSLCGDPFIDEQLRDITELIFRDVVTPWLSTLTNEDDVSEELKSLLFSVIRNISVRFVCSQINRHHCDDFSSWSFLE